MDKGIGKRLSAHPEKLHGVDAMKVAFSIIVFNLDYVLDAVLESIYPFASQILITEGPVQYFVKRGFTTSTDDTVEIIKS